MNDYSAAYLESRECLLAIRSRVDELTNGIDPAPWYEASAAALPGDNETPHVRQMAIYERANLTFFRAMLTGSLRGWFVDGGERWQIPGWAWADQGGDWHALIVGNDFLHPLAPPDVRRWAWLPVQVEEEEFAEWLRSAELDDQAGFPALPPAYDEASRTPHVTHLPPPNKPTVSLAHALSWLAFGISMDADTLTSALNQHVLGSNRADAHRRLERATELLLTAATGGLQQLGKFVPARGNHSAALTGRIDRERLEDFRQFDAVFDGLRYGTGVRWAASDAGMSIVVHALPDATNKYVDVKVERRALMALGKDDCRAAAASALGSPDDALAASQASRSEITPAGRTYAPANDLATVAPWWNVNQALAWIATRQVDFVEWVGSRERRESAIGGVLTQLLFEQDVASVQSASLVEDAWPNASVLAQAGRLLLRKLECGEVIARVRGFAIPIENFVGIGLDDTGADWLDIDPQPLFSSAEILAAFREGSACPAEPAEEAGVLQQDNEPIGNAPIERAPSVKAGGPPSDDEILAKADEMKASGLDGQTLAKLMHFEPGFENVATTEVRKLIKGRWKPGGRPKKLA